jgi:hypothetical protein
MRKTWITTQYTKIPTNGWNGDISYNHFGSLLIELEDEILIDSRIIEWKANQVTGEQSNNNEIGFTMNLDELKRNSHQILLFTGQTPTTASISPIWDIILRPREILREYLYSKIKEARTFSGLLNSEVDVEVYTINYIDNVIMKQYKFDTIDLYLSYINLNVGIPKFRTEWNSSIISEGNLVRNLRIEQNSLLPITQSIKFVQTLNPNTVTFDYAFNVKYNRI